MTHSQKALGLTDRPFGCLADLQIGYREADFTAGWDEASLDRLLTADTAVILLQRSRGYQERRALLSEDIAAIVRAVKARRPEIIVFVDNCYGEFVQELEPCHVGADLIAGSLIKNPGPAWRAGGG